MSDRTGGEAKGRRNVASDPGEGRAFEEKAPERVPEVQEAAEDEEAPLSGTKRLGYAVLGGAIAAMGFWIFPYQLGRGDLLKTLLGAALAILGSIVLFRALSRRRLSSLEGLIDFLSDLAG